MYRTLGYLFLVSCHWVDITNNLGCFVSDGAVVGFYASCLWWFLNWSARTSSILPLQEEGLLWFTPWQVKSNNQLGSCSPTRKTHESSQDNIWDAPRGIFETQSAKFEFHDNKLPIFEGKVKHWTKKCVDVLLYISHFRQTCLFKKLELTHEPNFALLFLRRSHILFLKSRRSRRRGEVSRASKGPRDATDQRTANISWSSDSFPKWRQLSRDTTHITLNVFLQLVNNLSYDSDRKKWALSATLWRINIPADKACAQAQLCVKWIFQHIFVAAGMDWFGHQPLSACYLTLYASGRLLTEPSRSLAAFSHCSVGLVGFIFRLLTASRQLQNVFSHKVTTQLDHFLADICALPVFQPRELVEETRWEVQSPFIETVFIISKKTTYFFYVGCINDHALLL